MPNNTILRGIVGSTAYGLAREGSDIDRLGVFITPSREIAGFDWTPKDETNAKSGPEGDDHAEHELRKYIRLALKCNPTILELLWIDSYEIKNYIGAVLVESREKFFSQKYIKSAYLGYASAQLKKFQDHDFKPKHARHALRLVRQGSGIYFTGQLTLKVDDPQEYWDFDNLEPGAMLDKITSEFISFENSEELSPLPETIDDTFARELLEYARSSN